MIDLSYEHIPVLATSHLFQKILETIQILNLFRNKKRTLSTLRFKPLSEYSSDYFYNYKLLTSRSLKGLE